jgi:hypothetical protein
MDRPPPLSAWFAPLGNTPALGALRISLFLPTTGRVRRGHSLKTYSGRELPTQGAESRNKYKLFSWNHLPLWLLPMWSPKVAGPKIQKVSSPKCLDYFRRRRCSRSSELWLLPYRVSPPRCNRVRSSRWPRVTGLKSGPQLRIAPHRSGPISPPLVCKTGARAEKSWKLVL